MTLRTPHTWAWLEQKCEQLGRGRIQVELDVQDGRARYIHERTIESGTSEEHLERLAKKQLDKPGKPPVDLSQ